MNPELDFVLKTIFSQEGVYVQPESGNVAETK